jgi:hypothetical protein
MALRQKTHRRFSTISRIGLAALAVILVGGAVHAAAINFIHIATSANTTGNRTEIDHPAANGNPDAILLVTHNLSPNGVPGLVNDHPIGVGYGGETGRWVILNQDLADMPIGAAFNVRIAEPGSASALVHETSAANCTMNFSSISHSAADGHPYVLVFATPRLELTRTQAVYNSHPTGVWYYTDKAKWTIYNERLANGNYTSALAMPAGIGFNVEIRERSAQSAFMHTADASNTPTTLPSYRQTYTIIDHPLTNGSPQAIVFVAHNYSLPSESDGGRYLNSSLAVNYLPVEQKWAIVLTSTDPGSTTPFTDSSHRGTAAFNVLVTAAERPVARLYVGESAAGSVQEALDDALQQLDEDLGEGGIRDALATWEMVEVTGMRGGFAGFMTVRVTIRATRSPSW